MVDATVEQLLLALDVSVDALAMCDVAAGRRLAGSSGDAIVVHYVLEGALCLDIEGHGPVRCGKGGLVLVPPQTAQLIFFDGLTTEDVLAEDCAEVAPDGLIRVDAAEGQAGDLRFACGGISANVANLLGIFEPGSAPLVEPFVDVEFIGQAFDLMLREMTSQQIGARAVSGALMKACLLLMVRRRLERRGDGGDPQTRQGARMGDALRGVLQNPALPHSVASLAATAGMSRSCFAREFVSAFGVTPMTFVAKSRLHHAAGLLRSSLAPIKAVAATAGFQSRSHFSRVFRKSFGMDPSAYRRAPVLPVTGDEAPPT